MICTAAVNTNTQQFIMPKGESACWLGEALLSQGLVLARTRDFFSWLARKGGTSLELDRQVAASCTLLAKSLIVRNPKDNVGRPLVATTSAATRYYN